MCKKHIVLDGLIAAKAYLHETPNEITKAAHFVPDTLASIPWARSSRQALAGVGREAQALSSAMGDGKRAAAKE